jgi:hypothetical protein
MHRFRRRETRKIRRLAKAFAALDAQAGAVRPRPARLLRSSAVSLR